MPVISLSNSRLIEDDSSFDYAIFRVSLDEVAAAPVGFSYFTIDGTASSRLGDYQPRDIGSATIPAGESFVDIRVAIYGDNEIESDETFQLVLTAGQNATLEGDAAALIATGTILDDDGGTPNQSSGFFGSAAQLDGPTAEPSSVPTLRVHDAGMIEGDSSFDNLRFLVTLDRPAPAPVSVDYYTQGISAHDQSGDFNERVTTLTIPAGQQAAWIPVSIYGDTLIEGDESFEVVFGNINNAIFEGEAEVLIATGSIIEDDNGPISGPGGIGDPAEQVQGPGSSGAGPTVRVSDVKFLEGDGSFNYAYMLITLDGPANVPVSFDYYTQDVTASGPARDYSPVRSSVSLPAGTESEWVRIAVYGDSLIEASEAFDVVFTGISGGQFEDNAAALISRVSIIEDDVLGDLDDGGIGDPAVPAGIAESASTTTPTLQIFDTAVFEGNSSFNYANFLVTLDRPATAPVNVSYVTYEGSAESGVDYSAQASSLTIPAGEQSAYISVPVYGDTAIEGNETYQLLLYGIENAVFRGDYPALLATGTIIDNDSIGALDDAGIGDRAPLVVPPSQAGATVRITTADISITEGDSSFRYHYIPVLLSGPVGADVRIEWRTLEEVGALSGTDFVQSSSTLTIPAGEKSGVVRIGVYGDTEIEAEESFIVEFSSPDNAAFANGQSTMTARITINDDDGASTASSFVSLATSDVVLTPDPNELLVGTPGNDTLDGLAGNDTIRGLDSADSLNGGTDDDSVDGGSGDDVVVGGAGNDTLIGGLGRDTLIGGDGDDQIDGGPGNGDLRDIVYGGAGNDFIDGGYGNDELRGDAGNDSIAGGFGVDTVIGGTGDDVMTGSAFSDLIFGGDGSDFVNGGFGSDRVNGGDGADRFFHVGVTGHGSDWIQDFDHAEGDVMVYGGSATIDQFQVKRGQHGECGGRGNRRGVCDLPPHGPDPLGAG